MSRSLKTTRNLSQIAEKKLVGKAHSSANKTDNAEDIPSAVQLNTTTIFGQPVPSKPADNITTTLWDVTGNVQKVQFDVVEIGLTRYDADASTEAGGDDSPQSNGPHGWALVMTSDYETSSSGKHSKVGTAPYENSTKVYETLGALQLVPTNMYLNASDPANNPYTPKIYTWDGSNNSSKSATPLTISDHLDWFVDAYAGTVFFQEYDGRVPYKVEAYIYIGDMAATTGGAGAFTDLSDTPNNYSSAASKFVKVNSGGNGIEFATVTIPSAINDLSNVNTGTPSNDQVLVYNSSSSEWVAGNQGNSETVSGFSTLRAPHSSTTKEITVTVVSKDSSHRYNGTGSGSGYALDGVQSPFLTLTPGRTYRFLQSDGSNSGHPLRFYYDAAKTTQYTTGVTTSGVAGNSGAYVDIAVTDATPTVLHYQCTAHGYMGNSIQLNARNLTGFALKDLPDVHTASPTNGQALIWDDSNSYWKPGNIDAGGIERYTYERTGSSAAAGTDITISGLDFNGATPTTADTKVFLNGQLLQGGTTSQLSSNEVDYAFSSDTQIKFGFILEVGDHVAIYYITTSFSTGKDILLHTEDTSFDQGRVLTAGDGITISTATPRQMIINNSGLLQRTKENFVVSGFTSAVCNSGVSPNTFKHTITFAGSYNFGTAGVNYSDNRIDLFVNGALKEKDFHYKLQTDSTGASLSATQFEWIDTSNQLQSTDRITIIIF